MWDLYCMSEIDKLTLVGLCAPLSSKRPLLSVDMSVSSPIHSLLVDRF